jgi:hypothetical protein
MISSTADKLQRLPQTKASRGLINEREKEAYRIQNGNSKIVDKLLSINSRKAVKSEGRKPVKKRMSLKEMERAREIKRENQRLLKRIQTNSIKGVKTSGTTISDIKGKDYQIACARMNMISMYPSGPQVARTQRVLGERRAKIDSPVSYVQQESEFEQVGEEASDHKEPEQGGEEEFELDPAYLRKPYTASDHEDYNEYSEKYDDYEDGEGGDYFDDDDEPQETLSQNSKFSSVFEEASSANSSHYYWDEFE